MMKISSLLLSGCLLMTSVVMAQDENKGWELGGRMGPAWYFGDLNNDFDFTKPGGVIGVGAHYNFNNRISLGTMLSGARIYYRDEFSDNLFQQARNLSFRTDLVELAGRFEFNFMEYIHGDLYHSTTPYLHGGFSVFYYQPTAEWEGERYFLRDLGTEGQPPGSEYNWLSGAFTFGAGLKIDLNYRWSIQLDLSARILFTDYLDDVSGVYANPDDIRSFRPAQAEAAVALADRSIANEQFPTVGESGRQRGNGKNNDSFVFFTTGIYYFFGYTRCPKVSPLH